MPKDADAKTSPRLTLLVIAAVIVAVAVGFWLNQPKKSDETGPAPRTAPETVKMPVKDRPVIDYGRLDKDQDLDAAMQQRKDLYGIDKGIDFIVKPDESIKIGDITVPMAEILEKIRLQKGDIIENDLTDRQDLEKIRAERKARIAELVRAEARYAEIAPMLKDPNISQKPKQHEALVREHADLGGIVALFKKYKATLQSIEKNMAILADGDAEAKASARTTLRALKIEAEKLERLLRIPHLPEKKTEAYGIYVVRPGDNIWNIHFKFLKAYFGLRNVGLSPVSDEPDARGFSSGVGKILKFSENMVYIYNLREKKLDVDLNLLQPLSKIVIFNMGEVFALLDPIDYSRVNRIRFDGETLWIPAEQ